MGGNSISKTKHAGMIAIVIMLLIAASCMLMQGCSSSKSKDSSASANTAASASASASSKTSSSAANEASSGATADAKNAGMTDGIQVPDLVGKNLGDVKDEIKDFDVDYLKADGSKANVFMKSNWRVDEQSLEPGSVVPKDSKLTLKLGHITEEKAAEEKAEKEAKEAEERANIDYITVSAAQLVDDLDSNAMNAKETYKDGYYRVTGVVSNIDASGKYINIDPEGVAYNFTNIQCFLNDDAARDAVRNMSKGDAVTVCGKVTDVGEFLGYSIDVYFFE